MKATRWLALVSVAMLAACGGGDGGTGPGNGGPAFTADVTGDLETSLQGDALFGEIFDPEAGAAFAVEMSESDPTGGGLIQFIRIGAGVPGAGTYALTDAINGNPGDGDWVAAAFDTENGEVTAIFAATAGSIKVTGVSQNSFKGTFSFDAAGGLLSDPETSLSITVTGRFTASSLPEGQAIQGRITSIRRNR